MSMLNPTTVAPKASDVADRLVGAFARAQGQGSAQLGSQMVPQMGLQVGTPVGSLVGSQGGALSGGFSQTLSKLSPQGTQVTVRSGDTLSSLIQKHMQQSPVPVSLSADQLYRVAVKVAADNGIANANLIYPAQRIDLSKAQSLAMAEVLQPGAAQTPGGLAQTKPAALAASDRWPAAGDTQSAAGDTQSAAGPQAFMAKHALAAQQAQKDTGIPATFMVAQAALESGWGRKEIRLPDGQPSHNLFGIRTGANWKGPVAEVWTTEYVNGSAQRVRGQFRAYGSYEESFNDYARLISQNPRYAGAMRNLNDPQAFASSLQQAGYATAPNYGKVLASVIQTAQRLQGGVPDMASRQLPTTAQVLGMRPVLPDVAQPLSALNTLNGPTGAALPGQRQWRQSPYAALELPKMSP